MLFKTRLKEFNVQLLLIENATNINDYAEVDLSENTLANQNIDASNHEQLQAYLDAIQQKTKAKVLYGGYLEKRNLYTKSPLFNADAIRNIHLGVDFWAAAETGILAPLDGVVYAAHYNEGEGNYGGTIILKHTINAVPFFSLYGHLSKASLQIKKGKQVNRGERFCYLGKANENGNYVPHLHFQWILALPENACDYHGVCSADEIAKYVKNSPKPELVIENS